MNTCWKCGKPVGEGQVECEYGCDGSDATERQRKYSGEIISLAEWLRDMRKHYAPINWDTVKTFDDLVLIMSVLYQNVLIDPQSDRGQKILRYLKLPGADTTNPS